MGVWAARCCSRCSPCALQGGLFVGEWLGFVSKHLFGEKALSGWRFRDVASRHRPAVQILPAFLQSVCVFGM